MFAGAVDGRDVVASPWTPPSWTADDTGRVRPELVWAVLDCPTYFALYKDEEELPLSMLGGSPRGSTRPSSPARSTS